VTVSSTPKLARLPPKQDRNTNPYGFEKESSPRAFSSRDLAGNEMLLEKATCLTIHDLLRQNVSFRDILSRDTTRLTGLDAKRPASGTFQVVVGVTAYLRCQQRRRAYTADTSDATVDRPCRPTDEPHMIPSSVVKVMLAPRNQSHSTPPDIRLDRGIDPIPSRGGCLVSRFAYQTEV
jgi:hypothetical protein